MLILISNRDKGSWLLCLETRRIRPTKRNVSQTSSCKLGSVDLRCEGLKVTMFQRENQSRIQCFCAVASTLAKVEMPLEILAPNELISTAEGKKSKYQIEGSFHHSAR